MTVAKHQKPRHKPWLYYFMRLLFIQLHIPALGVLNDCSAWGTIIFLIQRKFWTYAISTKRPQNFFDISHRKPQSRAIAMHVRSCGVNFEYERPDCRCIMHWAATMLFWCKHQAQRFIKLLYWFNMGRAQHEQSERGVHKHIHKSTTPSITGALNFVKLRVSSRAMTQKIKPLGRSPESPWEEGTTATRAVEDTHTHIEHGEKTWETGQIVRDILQNHLDASTEMYVEGLRSMIVDSARVEQKDIEDVETALQMLLWFKQSKKDVSAETRAEMRTLVFETLRKIPLTVGARLVDDLPHLDAIEQLLDAIVERQPRITYQMKNHGDGGTLHWILREELEGQSEYRTLREDGGEKWEIVGVKIEDLGPGFDAKLGAFYLSTKGGKKYLRGKFGEGVKMSTTALIRGGASIKTRSLYEVDDGGVKTARLWQRHARLSAKQTIELKGVDIQMSKKGERATGSATTISWNDAHAKVKKELQANLDPRTGGLQKNCLEYQSGEFVYPVGFRVDSGPSHQPSILIGVNINGDASRQYVQGLRIAEGKKDASESGKELFSYNIADSSVLRGRDRNERSEEKHGMIVDFWTHCDNPYLLHEMAERVISDPYAYLSPEGMALERLLARTWSTTSDRQLLRTRNILYEVFINLLDIVPGRTAIVEERKSNNEREKEAQEELRAGGWNIVTVQSSDHLVCRAFNNFYNGRYNVQRISELKGSLRASRKELSPESEQVELVRELLLVPAYEELKKITDAATQLDTVIKTVVYERVLGARSEKPISVALENGRFVLHIRPELIMENLRNDADIAYWQMAFQVQLLSLMWRSEEFLGTIAQLMHAQVNGDTLLARSLSSLSIDMAVCPEVFAHQKREMVRDGSPGEKQEKISPELLRLWRRVYEYATKPRCAIGQLKEMIAEAQQLSLREKMVIKMRLLNRTIISKDKVAICAGSRDGEISEHVVERGSLTTVGTVVINGTETPIAILGDRFIAPYKMPEGTIIKYEGKTFVFTRAAILEFGEMGCNKYDFKQYKGLNFDGEGFVWRDMFSGKREESVEKFREVMSALEIILPEPDEAPVMQFDKGVIPTPFPLEYGIGEWDKPMRVFQDLVQNHLDAAGGLDIFLAYEVLRYDARGVATRSWVQSSGVQPDDVLVGVRISDDGHGYAPDQLGTIGEHRKKNPLLAGKYGEGQKMVAAAAARHGFALRFSSKAMHEGVLKRWEADVKTQDEDIVIAGTKRKKQRVVFEVQSAALGADNTHASSTELRVENDKVGDPEWQRWMLYVDPRFVDGRGNSGLGQGVRKLREKSEDGVIDLGYMKILLNERGRVYENGLLVSENEHTVVGYDVPEVVRTRERNACNKEKLQGYISHALRSTTDERLIRILVKEWKTKYAEAMRDYASVSIKEDDLQFGKIFSPSSEPFFSQSIWQKVMREELGGIYVHSESELERRLRYFEPVSADERNVYLEQSAERAMRTLANVAHIPKEKLVLVGAVDYLGWSRIIDTTEKYVEALMSQETPTDPKTREALYAIASKSAEVIERMFKEISKNEKFKVIMHRLLTQEIGTKNGLKIISDRIREWQHASRGSDGREKVFVSPEHVGYLGTADAHRIGINERLLLAQDQREVVETMRHELLHKIFDVSDYKEEFVMLLLLLIKQEKGLL